jgi:uncharacterized repeat protein (TIGR03833 family)
MIETLKCDDFFRVCIFSLWLCFALLPHLRHFFSVRFFARNMTSTGAIFRQQQQQRGAITTSSIKKKTVARRRRVQHQRATVFRRRKQTITAGAFNTHSFDAPGNFRENLSVGLSVGIVLKEDQGTDAIVYGKISDFLTNSKRHPRGIKVRLEDGSIGRVCEIGEGEGQEKDEEKETSVASAKEKGSSDDSEDTSDDNDEDDREEEDDKEEEESNVVYVRGLPKNEEDIEKVKEAILAIVLDNHSNSGIEKDDIVSIKIPKRSGTRAIQGFGFIECKDVEIATNVIRELNGQSLEIAASKSDDGSSNDSETTAMKISASFSVNKKKKTKKDDDIADGERKSKKSRPTKAEKERLEQEKKEQQILEARKAMEEDALKLLERQRKEKERKEKEIQAKLEKEEVARQAKEKRTMELLLKRKEAQERNRAKVQAEQERLEQIDREARALGDITIDESWLTEMEEIKATISALK